MKQLLVHSYPKLDQSVECYLAFLARENGFNSTKAMMQRVLHIERYDADKLLIGELSELTGHSESVLQSLGLLRSESHMQPTHTYGNILIPSYHLQRDHWYCPSCVKEHGYLLAKWRIGWLPVCTKHRCALIRVDQHMWEQGDLYDFGEASNDDFFDEKIFEVQSLLENRLDNQKCNTDSTECIIDLIDEQLFRCLSEKKAALLLDRKRRYSKKYFPYSRENQMKFMDCLYTQFIERS